MFKKELAIGGCFDCGVVAAGVAVTLISAGPFIAPDVEVLLSDWLAFSILAVYSDSFNFCKVFTLCCGSFTPFGRLSSVFRVEVPL